MTGKKRKWKFLDLEISDPHSTMSKKKKKSEAHTESPSDVNAINREDCDCPCHWMPRWIRRPRFMRGWEWEDTSATLAVLTAAACTVVAFKMYQKSLLER